MSKEKELEHYRKEAKRRKLKQYEEKDIKIFYQYDGFRGMGYSYNDSDGDGIFNIITEELMQGSVVRVLIPLDVDKKIVLRMFDKIRKVIENNHPII